jgi:hypothetical protein
MNPIEKKAHQWLINYGIPENAIIYDSKGIFDFKTPQGVFECKKLCNKGRTIFITEKQKTNDTIAKPTYLIFSDNSISPLMIGSLEEINKKIDVKCAMPSNSMSEEKQIMVKVSDPLLKKVIAAMDWNENLPATYAVDQALRELLKLKERKV